MKSQLPEPTQRPANTGAIYNLGYNGQANIARVVLLHCVLAQSLGGVDLANNAHTNLITDGFNNLANQASATIVYSGSNLVMTAVELDGGTSSGPTPRSVNPLLGRLTD